MLNFVLYEIAEEEPVMPNIHPTMMRGSAAIDEIDDARPPSSRVLFARLQAAQERWRNSTGRKRDEAMTEVLRLAKAIDAA